MVTTEKRHSYERSIRAWLESLPQVDAVTIVVRSALRSAPFFWANRGQVLEQSGHSGSILVARTILPAPLATRVSRVSFMPIAKALDAAIFSVLTPSLVHARTSIEKGSGKTTYDQSQFAIQAAIAAARAASSYAAAAAYSGDDAAFAEHQGFASGCLLAVMAAVDEEAAWLALQRDRFEIAAGRNPFEQPLWAGGTPDWVPMVHREWSALGNAWEFWVDWYEGYLIGKPLDLDLLERVALIPSADWDRGETHVNGMIAEIYDAFRKKAPDRIDPLFAALFDFSFDEFAGVMRAIPMPDDWQTLTDPDRLAAFLADATDLRDDLGLLAAALAAEGQAMQGAGAVRAYLNAVEKELERAEEFRSLRVGKLLEYGRILEAASLSDETLREFGVAGEALKICVAKLRDLVRAHFAHTLSRLGILREMRMEEGVSPWEVLREFRFLVDDVKTGAQGRLPKLAAEDAAVLTDILDSADGMIRALESNSRSEDARNGLKRDIDFQLAKVGATARVYGDRAARAVGKSNDAADAAIKAHKRWDGLQAIGRAIREFLQGGGGA